MRTALALLLLTSCSRSVSTPSTLPYARESFTLPRVLGRAIMHTKGCGEVAIDGWNVDATCDGVRLHFVQRPNELRFGCDGVDKDSCMLLARRVVGEDIHGRRRVDPDLSDGGGTYGGDDVDLYGGGVYGGGMAMGGTHLVDSGYDENEQLPPGQKPSMTITGHDYVIFRDKAMPEQARVRITAIAKSDPAYKKSLIGAECVVDWLRKPAAATGYEGVLECSGSAYTFTAIDVELIGDVVTITDVGTGDAFFDDKATLMGMQCIAGPIEGTDGQGYMRGALYCDGAYLYFAEVKFAVIGHI